MPNMLYKQLYVISQDDVFIIYKAGLQYIHTVCIPSCNSAILSVHQQPEGTEVAYQQLAIQEFKYNPGKQM